MDAGAIRQVPYVVLGLGGAGAAATTWLARGLENSRGSVVAIERNGPVDDRARNITLKHATRGMLEELTGREFGADVAISDTIDAMRAAAVQEPAAELRYHTKVLDLVERPDFVEVLHQRVDPTDGRTPIGAPETVRADVVLNATGAGGKLAATQQGAMARRDAGPSHVYVTAQYDAPSPHGGLWAGVFDRHSREAFAILPVADGSQRYITYMDLPAGAGVTHLGVPPEPGKYASQELLDRYARYEQRLGLPEPSKRAVIFDARQHISDAAASARIVNVGDAVGNSDPLTAAGLNTAITDARDATEGLLGPGALDARVQRGTRHLVPRHQENIAQGTRALAARDVLLRAFTDMPLDAMRGVEDLDPSWLVTTLARATRFDPVYAA